MHYFDSRGVKRLFMTNVDGSTWKIWRAPGRIGTVPTDPASISASSARSRLTARRSTAAGSAAWGTPETSGRSTSRSPTSARTLGTRGLVLKSKAAVGGGQPGDRSIGGVVVELDGAKATQPGPAARERDVRRPGRRVGDGGVEGESRRTTRRRPRSRRVGRRATTWSSHRRRATVRAPGQLRRFLLEELARDSRSRPPRGSPRGRRGAPRSGPSSRRGRSV